MSVARQFTGFSRLLHWVMAVMVVAMLFIGVGMVASLANYHLLVSIPRPLGITILVLFATPLVGWAMLSAARYPIVLYGSLHLPPRRTTRCSTPPCDGHTPLSLICSSRPASPISARR